MNLNFESKYNIVFTKYPDVVTVRQMCEMLHINLKAGYKLLHSGQIKYLKIGNTFRIPKLYILEFLQNSGEIAVPFIDNLS